jgi:phage replication O-like protein O
MESPQVENGHVKIANELYEAMLKIKLSDYEHRILGAIIRKTYGWNKKQDWISHSQLSELTSILPHHCARTITKLKNKKIIIKKDGLTTINKHYSEWLIPKQVLPIQVIPKQVLGGTQTGFDGVPKQVHTKDTITKDTITKDIKHPMVFYFQGELLKIPLKNHESFLKAYPEINFVQEYLKMDAWLIANPEKMKKNHARFALNWLSSNYKRSGGKPQNAITTNGPKPYAVFKPQE